MKLCVDLCSGSGGFSEAPFRAGWEVLRIDNDIRFANIGRTLIADIRNLDNVLSWIPYQPTLIVASPPCERFSLANRMFPKEGIRNALYLVGSVFEIIARTRPLNWVVENPKGRLRWFLGKPNSTIRLSDYGSRWMKPTDLWHNFIWPKIVEAQKDYEPSWSSMQNQGKGSTGLLRVRDPRKRAEIPLGLSQAVLQAVESE